METDPASEAYTTTGAARPKEHMSASESIWAPNGLATPNLRASAPSRPSKTTQAMRAMAAVRVSPRIARKIASMPSIRLERVQDCTMANLIRRAGVRSPGRSGIDIDGASSTGVDGPTAGLIGITEARSWWAPISRRYGWERWGSG